MELFAVNKIFTCTFATDFPYWNKPAGWVAHVSWQETDVITKVIQLEAVTFKLSWKQGYWLKTGMEREPTSIVSSARCMHLWIWSVKSPGEHRCLNGSNNSVRDISGTEYRWALKMGQRPISNSFTCKNQDFWWAILHFHGPVGKNDGPKNP